jgi:hypothetical protein
MDTTRLRLQPILSAISTMLRSVVANSFLIFSTFAADSGFPCPRSIGVPTLSMGASSVLVNRTLVQRRSTIGQGSQCSHELRGPLLRAYGQAKNPRPRQGANHARRRSVREREIAAKVGVSKSLIANILKR